MKKWILLVFITVVLFFLQEAPSIKPYLHPSYRIMLAFFAIQAFVLFRMDSLIPDPWKIHGSLVKIIVRFLSSAVFILVLMYQYPEPYQMVVQFILLYLVYMVFEIGVALTNLRRN